MAALIAYLLLRRIEIACGLQLRLQACARLLPTTLLPDARSSTSANRRTKTAPDRPSWNSHMLNRTAVGQARA